MLSTLLVIGAVFVGLLVLLAIIVRLSGQGRNTRVTTTAGRGTTPPKWVVDTGQKHADAWAPLSNTSTEIRAVR